MKNKKFKFEQTVITIVETKYVYKVEAKSYEQAECKFKEAFDKKLENGTSFSPVKKYLSKMAIVDTQPASPEQLGHSTLTVSFLPDKKTGETARQLYNNQENSWLVANSLDEGKEDEDIL